MVSLFDFICNIWDAAIIFVSLSFVDIYDDLNETLDDSNLFLDPLNSNFVDNTIACKVENVSMNSSPVSILLSMSPNHHFILPNLNSGCKCLCQCKKKNKNKNFVVLNNSLISPVSNTPTNSSLTIYHNEFSQESPYSYSLPSPEFGTEVKKFINIKMEPPVFNNSNNNSNGNSNGNSNSNSNGEFCFSVSKPINPSYLPDDFENFSSSLSTTPGSSNCVPDEFLINSPSQKSIIAPINEKNKVKFSNKKFKKNFSSTSPQIKIEPNYTKNLSLSVTLNELELSATLNKLELSGTSNELESSATLKELDLLATSNESKLSVDVIHQNSDNKENILIKVEDSIASRIRNNRRKCNMRNQN